jgi:hypothetical protein
MRAAFPDAAGEAPLAVENVSATRGTNSVGGVGGHAASGASCRSPASSSGRPLLAPETTAGLIGRGRARRRCRMGGRNRTARRVARSSPFRRNSRCRSSCRRGRPRPPHTDNRDADNPWESPFRLSRRNPPASQDFNHPPAKPARFSPSASGRQRRMRLHVIPLPKFSIMRTTGPWSRP